jgi:hypothetical protein
VLMTRSVGTPNGQSVGYFLAQHKHRFGKSKTVDKVQLFRPDKGMLPYMLFWVADAPALPGPSDVGIEDDDSGYASGEDAEE